MWSTDQEHHRRHHNRSARVVSSSSSSPRSYFSSSSSSSSMVPRTKMGRTMEEVWSEIALPTPRHQRRPVSVEHHHPVHPHPIHRPHPTSSPSFRGMILKDFLAGPCKGMPSPTAAMDAPAPAPAPLPPLPTLLTLNSATDLQYMVGPSAARPASTHSNNTSNSDSSFPHRQADASGEHPNAPFIPHSFSDSMIASPPPAGLFCFCPQKRVLDDHDDADGGGGDGDLRHKRMIKNRESAARSRARKQAYTNELELEVAHLVEENGRLKKEYEELRLAMAAHHLPIKKTLQRTTTSPF